MSIGVKCPSSCNCDCAKVNTETEETLSPTFWCLKMICGLKKTLKQRFCHFLFLCWLLTLLFWSYVVINVLDFSTGWLWAWTCSGCFTGQNELLSIKKNLLLVVTPFNQALTHLISAGAGAKLQLLIVWMGWGLQVSGLCGWACWCLSLWKILGGKK